MKAVAPASREELDIQKLQIKAEHAIATAEELRQQALIRQEEVLDARNAIKQQAEEVDEIYTYLDTQMLHSARERCDQERRYRQEVKESAAQVAELLQRLADQAAQAAETEARLQQKLDSVNEEMRSLVEFRSLRPKMEAEIEELKQELAEVSFVMSQNLASNVAVCPRQASLI